MEPSLLAAVIAEPDDDFPRLVLADWLEEAGQADRAEFIRVQCRIAEMDETGEGEIDPQEGHTCHLWPCPVCTQVEKYQALRRREQELQGLHGDTWALPLALAAGFPDTPMHGATSGKDSFGNPRYHNICSEYASDGDRRLAWTFRRGFVAEVSCPTATWLTHGPALVTCQPLERVTLTDCYAIHRDREPGFRSYALVGPEEHLDAIRRSFPIGWHETEEGILNALSLAALTWARGQAAPCPACGGDGIREVDTGGNVWQSPCPDCAGTGRRRGRAADMPRPEQSAARTPS